MIILIIDCVHLDESYEKKDYESVSQSMNLSIHLNSD